MCVSLILNSTASIINCLDMVSCQEEAMIRILDRSYFRNLQTVRCQIKTFLVPYLQNPLSQVKICDFGVAEELDPFSQADTIKGSQGAPMFIAPEIAVGKDVFSGQKLDVWSAGVSLYNFVTGNYPFNADNVFKLYRKIGEGKYVIPDYLPENLKNLLEVYRNYCLI